MLMLTKSTSSLVVTVLFVDVLFKAISLGSYAYRSFNPHSTPIPSIPR